MQDIHKQSNAFTGKPRPVKVSTNKLSKVKGSDVSASNARNAVSSAISQEGVEDLADAHSRVRKQIVTWEHFQSNIHLRQLKEHREFKIIIEQRITLGGRFSAAILCGMCNKMVNLNVSERYVRLSNWIRHVKHCIQQKEGKQKSQLALTNFFRSSSESSSSEILTPDPSSPYSMDSNLSTSDSNMPSTHVASANLSSPQVVPVTLPSTSQPSLQITPVTVPSAS